MRIELCRNRIKMSFGHAKMAFPCNSDISLQCTAPLTIARDGNDVIDSFVGEFEFAQSQVSGGKVSQDVWVFGIERSGFFQISSGLSFICLDAA